MPQQSLLDPAPQIAGIGGDVRAHRPAQKMFARLAGQEGQPLDRGVADVAVDVRQIGADHLARKSFGVAPRPRAIRHNQLEKSSSGSRLGR